MYFRSVYIRIPTSLEHRMLVLQLGHVRYTVKGRSPSIHPINSFRANRHRRQRHIPTGVAGSASHRRVTHRAAGASPSRPRCRQPPERPPPVSARLRSLRRGRTTTTSKSLRRRHRAAQTSRPDNNVYLPAAHRRAPRGERYTLVAPVLDPPWGDRRVSSRCQVVI